MKKSLTSKKSGLVPKVALSIVASLILIASLSFTLTLAPDAPAKADTLVDPVIIDFPEDAHVAIGMDLNDLLPLININQRSSYGAFTVAELPEDTKTDADKQYEGYIVGKCKVGSNYGYDSVNLNNNPVIEEGYEYSVQFYYGTISGYSLSSEYDPSHALVNGEPVSGLALAGVGSKYRQVIITLSPADWGSASYDLANGEATLSNRASGVVLQRTFKMLSEFESPLVNCEIPGANQILVDIDKDGTNDILVNIGSKNSTTQLITKQAGASAKGKYEFKIPKSDMPYNGEGICCNKSVYSTLTIDFGGSNTPDPTAAPVQNPTAAPSQNTPTNNANNNAAPTNAGKTSQDDTVEHEKINLPKVVIKKCKAGAKGTVALKWKSIDAADGYEIAYTTDKNFKKSVKTKKVEKNSFTLKKLKKKKVYYIRIRAYVDDGKMITGKWSVAKRIKTKK